MGILSVEVDYIYMLNIIITLPPKFWLTIDPRQALKNEYIKVEKIEGTYLN